MQHPAAHSTPSDPSASLNMASIPPSMSLLTSLMSTSTNIALHEPRAVAVPEQNHLALGSDELTQQLLAMVSAQLSYLQLSQQQAQALCGETPIDSMSHRAKARMPSQVRNARRYPSGLDCMY